MVHYPLAVARPVTENDLDSLMDLAEQAGPGMTNLPKDEGALQEKIETSLHSFQNGKEESEILGYFFVLEDITSKKIVGCSGITGAGSHMMPFYHFKMSTVKYVSQEVNQTRDHQILTMVNDYQGCTEICSLFLRPDYREHHNGSLISRTRFLFMAEKPHRFNKTIIAEMRGVVNDDGSQPFWDNVIRKFIDMPYLQADKLTGMGIKQFISDLMPRYPLYVDILPDAAQAVIDKVHKDTKPALAMLKREGFQSHGYIDIFEAGTMVQCELDNIYTARKSKKQKISKVIPGANRDNGASLFLISNTSRDFRVCIANLEIDKDTQELHLYSEVAELLNLAAGDDVRYVPLKVK